MSEFVFFLEEASARTLLEIIVPKIISPAPICRFIVFEGKQDLEKRLAKRMRGYLCRELEVNGLAARQQERRFRNPDGIISPAKKLSKIAPAYQKIGGSRLIGPHLNIQNPRSTSFRNFVAGIQKLAKP